MDLEVIKKKLFKMRKELEELNSSKERKEGEILKSLEAAPIDSDLLFFYGRGCSFTKKAEPIVMDLEISLGKRLIRLETWYDTTNQKLYEETGGPTNCGGVPYFFNKQTGRSVCGAQGLEVLKAWAACNADVKNA